MKPLLLLTCVPLAFLSCPKPDVEPTVGEVAAIAFPPEVPTPLILACLRQVPQDCTRLLDAYKRSGIPSVQAANDEPDGGDVTYHNDNVGGEDGSVRLDLKDAMLALPKKNVFSQHTHGRAHTLYVMTKVPNGTGCKTELREYRLQTGDEIRVFHGPKNQPVPWQKIINSTGNTNGSHPPDVRITRAIKSGVSVPGCSTASHPDPTTFFEVEALNFGSNGKLTDNPSITMKPQPVDVQLLRFETTAQTFIRRIAVSNNGVVRHYIKLGGCSAYKICTRAEAQECESAPLCRLRESALEHCACDGNQ